MEGMEFKTFDQFRSKFWQSVAEDKALSSEFSRIDLLRMKKGISPVAPQSQHLGEMDKLSIISYCIDPISTGR